MYKIRPKEFVNSSLVFGTMSSRCLIALCLFVAAHSASIKKRNIPVEVLYEKSNHGNRNLEEKVQISHNDLLRLKLSDDIINEGREQAAIEEEAYVSKIQSYGVRNLDAKVQLSPEDLQQAVKHLPSVDDEDLVKAELQAQTPENATHTLDMLKKVEEIVFAGICTIKNNVDRLIETNSKPSEEEWEKLNQTLQNFFAEQHRKISLKQDQPTDNQNQNNQNQNNQNNQFFENLMNGFQSITNNFIQTYFPQNQQNNGTEDEQSGQGQQGGNPFQNFISMFQGGINNIVNNFQNNQNNNGTGQEDTGNEQNNFFGNVVNSIQQFFSNQNPSQSSNNQSDTGTSSNNQGPTQIFQSIGNQIGNFFNPTTKPPNSEDEGAGSTTQSNFINNIGQAFQNFNFFGQSTTPASQGGGSNPISQVGSQFQQLVGGQGGNPIAEGIQNAIGGSTTEKNKGDGEKSQEDAGTPANEKMPQEEGGSATPANEKMVEKNEGSSTVTSANEEPQKEGSTENEMLAQKNEEISSSTVTSANEEKPEKESSSTAENEMLAQKNEEISTSATPEVKNTEEMAEVVQKVE